MKKIIGWSILAVLAAITLGAIAVDLGFMKFMAFIGIMGSVLGAIILAIYLIISEDKNRQ